MSLIGKISLKEYNCFISGAVTDSTGILADIELTYPTGIRISDQTKTSNTNVIRISERDTNFETISILKYVSKIFMFLSFLQAE
jgi:hypothetical protein